MINCVSFSLGIHPSAGKCSKFNCNVSTVRCSTCKSKIERPKIIPKIIPKSEPTLEILKSEPTLEILKSEPTLEILKSEPTLEILKSDLEHAAKIRRPGYLEMILKSKVSETDTHISLTENDYFKFQKEYGIPSGFRPTPTLKDAINITKALLAKKVSLDVFNERTEICKSCNLVRSSGNTLFCGQCGCSVLKDDKQILNLARVEENLPHWGCKHPQRNQGKGWKQ